MFVAWVVLALLLFGAGRLTSGRFVAASHTAQRARLAQ
jgi:hypothetical protein